MMEAMKEDGRKLSKEQQIQARRRAMVLTGKNWRDQDVATAVGVNERTVRQWKQHRREHGAKSLLSDERGRAVGEGRTLSPGQERQVRKLIADKMPDQLRLPFALWTRKAVAQLLEVRFGIRLPVRTMGEYLRRWGFTPQKPIKKAYEQNPGKVKRWLKEEYPAIAAQAKAQGAEIYWGDQTGVNNQPNAPRGYAPKGQTPTVSQRSKRFGLSVMSAVSNRGSARWMVYKGALNAALLIKFMERLVRQMEGRKVYLILDNLRVHHSAPVKAWLEEHREKIAVHHLPSYSPELNPDERLNRSLKSKLGQLPAAKDERNLHRQTLAQLRSCHRQPVLIQAFFTSSTTSYAA
jgi:transposase